MTNPTPEALAELKAALRWTDDHLRSFADYHPEMRTRETEAIFWRNNQLLGTYPEPRHPTSEPLPDAVERAVKPCPQCEGEGGYPDGLDEAACHTDCTRCGGIGYIVDLSAMPASSREVGQVVAWLREKADSDLIASKGARTSTTESLHLLRGGSLHEIADAIERGDHLSTPSDHGWRDIASAPKDGTTVILSRWGWLTKVSDLGDEPDDKVLAERMFDPNAPKVWHCCWISGGFWSRKYQNWNDGIEPSGLAGPTHWLPCPAPPHRGTDGSAE